MYKLPVNVPGPNAYSLPTTVGYEKHDAQKNRKPMYTMRIRPKSRFDTIGPGPAKYNPVKLTREGTGRAPVYSIAQQLLPLRSNLVPAPNAHNVHLVPVMKFNRPPLYSCGIRFRDDKRDQVPGPNAYDGTVAMVKNRAPCYSMRLQTKQPHGLEGPGPAAHRVPGRDLTHKRNPVYSMRQMYPIVADRSPRPGPAYNLMSHKPGDAAPQYSFGKRHSEWSPPMIVRGDNC